MLSPRLPITQSHVFNLQPLWFYPITFCYEYPLFFYIEKHLVRGMSTHTGPTAQIRASILMFCSFVRLSPCRLSPRKAQQRDLGHIFCLSSICVFYTHSISGRECYFLFSDRGNSAHPSNVRATTFARSYHSLLYYNVINSYYKSYMMCFM